MRRKSTESTSFKNWFLTAFLFISCAVSTTYAQGITAEHIAEIKTVTSSFVSDDGKFVAYTLSVPEDPFKTNKPNANHLYVLNTATGASKPYFTNASVSQLQFRPGKNTLTFISRKPGDATNAIYEIDFSGGEATKLFSYDNNILGYDWHPDGNKILFTVMDSGEKPQTSLTYAPDFYEETFGQRKALTHDLNNPNSTKDLNIEGSVYMLSWSPDGQKAAISVAPTSSVDDSFMKQVVKIINPTNGNVLATINNQGKLGQIVWNPDGSSIALRAAKDLNDPTSGSILIVSTDDRTPRIIDANFLGKYEQLIWKDNNKIHFLASEGTNSVLGTIQANGSNKEVIYRTSDQAITSFSLAENNTFSFVASAPTHPAEVFTIANTRRATPEKKTDHNPWLNNLKLGKQEVITYTARDGQFDIEGILIYPVDYQKGTSVPLITVVHGGPESHYSNGWLTGYSNPGQASAARGYAVFYPNYRGSTGRGTEFTYSSQGNAAGKEFDDVVDGVDYLIEQGIADKNRIGVTGGSYGGYASAWMSTYYSDRFAAAVMFVGISNNISKWGTSDIPEELYLVHSRSWLWDNWQKSLESSPIYYVDRSQTPILIMHGSEDPRVHPAQSMELYRHIKVRKPEVPVRLIYYPGEGHGNRNSGSKYDYNLRMLQWFDTYLKTGNAKAEKPSLDLPVLQ